MGWTMQNNTKNPHVGEIGEGESDVCLLKQNNMKNPYAGEIGEGESDVRLMVWRMRAYRTSVYSTKATTWLGSPLWKEATAAMTALVYFIHKQAFIARNYTLYTTRVRCATVRQLQKRGENRSPQYQWYHRHLRHLRHHIIDISDIMGYTGQRDMAITVRSGTCRPAGSRTNRYRNHLLTKIGYRLLGISPECNQS